MNERQRIFVGWCYGIGVLSSVASLTLSVYSDGFMTHATGVQSLMLIGFLMLSGCYIVRSKVQFRAESNTQQSFATWIAGPASTTVFVLAAIIAVSNSDNIPSTLLLSFCVLLMYAVFMFAWLGYVRRKHRSTPPSG